MGVSRDLPFHIEDIHVPASGGDLVCSLMFHKSGPLAADPRLLINLGAGRKEMCENPNFYINGMDFIDNGSLVLTFDLPCHGERILPYGSDISGLCASWRGGDDPFIETVNDIAAIVDWCESRRMVAKGHVAVCGTSRGAYMAYRAFFAEKRLYGVSLISPVTDWRCLAEFADVRELPETRALALTDYIDGEDSRPVKIAIGNRDDRVSTEACLQFYLSLYRSRAAIKTPVSCELLVTDDVGHTLDPAMRRRMGELLARQPISMEA